MNMQAFLTLLRNGNHSDYTVEHEDTRYWFELDDVTEGFHIDHERIRTKELGMKILTDVDKGIEILQQLKVELEKELFERA